jgi:hypothetical protein
MINLYLAEGPGRLKLFVDSNGIYAYRKNGTIETYLWKDLVEIRTHAIWRGWRDILAVIFFFPPSVDVVFRDCRSLPIYNVFNGVECMAISGVMEGFSIFPKLYRLSENSELVLDKIVRIAPRLKFGLNRAD